MRDVSQKRREWCVIVADDDPDWRTLTTHSLRRSGYAVIEVCDGDELVARCRSLEAAGERHLVIVSDIEMPGCTGIEAIIALRSMNIDAVVLLVTGTQSSIVLDAARKSGAHAVLAKPVSGDRIVATVDTMRRPVLAAEAER